MKNKNTTDVDPKNTKNKLENNKKINKIQKKIQKTKEFKLSYEKKIEEKNEKTKETIRKEVEKEIKKLPAAKKRAEIKIPKITKEIKGLKKEIKQTKKEIEKSHEPRTFVKQVINIGKDLENANKLAILERFMEERENRLKYHKNKLTDTEEKIKERGLKRNMAIKKRRGERTALIAKKIEKLEKSLKKAVTKSKDPKSPIKEKNTKTTEIKENKSQKISETKEIKTPKSPSSPQSPKTSEAKENKIQKSDKTKTTPSSMKEELKEKIGSKLNLMKNEGSVKTGDHVSPPPTPGKGQGKDRGMKR